MKKPKWVMCLISSLITFLYGETIIVDTKGNGDFTDIQSAIYNASDGDTVFVRNGTYQSFGVPDIEINIIGEDQDSVIIDNSEGIYISSSKRCVLKNLYFEGIGAILADAYEHYEDIQVIPELIIENCTLDGRQSNQSHIGIWLYITYEDMLEEGVIDTLEKRIKIINNTFLEIDNAIILEMGGIISDKLLKVSSYPILKIDGRDNYYGIFDSVSIDASVYDRRDPVDSVLINSSNRALFNFVPWSDTLITEDYEITEGFRYNNFLNCEYAFKSGLIYDDSLVSNIPKLITPKSFEILKAYPNPFNNSTTIEFFLKQFTQVEIKIYNIKGQELTQFYRKDNLGNGLHKNKLSFTNETSGIYFVTIKTGYSFQKLKLLYLK